MSTRKKLENLKSKQELYKLQHKFYNTEVDADGQVKGIKINQLELCRQLRAMGYARYDINKTTSTFVHVNCSVVKEVTPDFIIDEFEDLVKKLPEDNNGVTPDFIMEYMYRGIDRYFSKAKLARLRVEKAIEFNQDTIEKSFFYFSNGYVVADKTGYKLGNYNDLNKYVWYDQQNKFDFSHLNFDAFHPEQLVNTKFDPENDKTLGPGGVFSQFLFHISGKELPRFISLLTIIGFNLHNNFEGKLKATVLTDSQVSEENEGRTGKTLLGKCLGKVRNFTELNGKDFKPEAKEKYAAVNLDTQIVHINDLRRGFDVENLYNDITEGIEIKKLYMEPFKIPVKMILSTNKSLMIQGASGRDRFIEFEFSNYYNDKYSPQNEFGMWFFSEWSPEEWNKFYNTMMYASYYYLKHGLQLPENENLKARKLLDYTCIEFINWIGDKAANNELALNTEYDKKELFLSFKNSNVDFANNAKFLQKTFTRWLGLYAQAKDYKVHARRANGVDYILFTN